jgi:hypothetical protein
VKQSIVQTLMIALSVVMRYVFGHSTP